MSLMWFLKVMDKCWNYLLILLSICLNPRVCHSGLNSLMLTITLGLMNG